MVNEDEVEPDFHIDRADQAVYVPIPKGLDKATNFTRFINHRFVCHKNNLNDRKDPDLFDFDLEVEPILQVLVGKSLELARIEVIEAFER